MNNNNPVNGELTHTAVPVSEHPAQGKRLSRTEKRAIVAATLGTIVEYTDWVIYATFSSILAHQFFPRATASLPCCQCWRCLQSDLSCVRSAEQY